jgi:hypothetical protein
MTLPHAERLRYCPAPSYHRAVVDARQFLKRARALSEGSWQDRGDGRFWIDHRVLDDHDVASLAHARDLTLWNVRLPPAALSRLSQLEVLDLRGGSGTSLAHLDGATGLRALTVNQVRGMVDLGAISGLPKLEYLSLYGLPRVEQLPPLENLPRLRRLELGQMKSLADLSPLLGAQALEELFFSKRLAVRVDDVRPLLRHPTLRAFEWVMEDVPVSQVTPVLKALNLAPAQAAFPAEWLAGRDSRD